MNGIKYSKYKLIKVFKFSVTFDNVFVHFICSAVYLCFDRRTSVVGQIKFFVADTITGCFIPCTEF